MAELGILPIFVIAFGLSADCLAVALSASVSITKTIPFHVLRTSLVFGAFQVMMPLIGWLAGQTIVDLIAGYDHWVAFILLAFVGGRMFWESLHQKDGHKQIDITKGSILIVLAIATSIDALAVGLTFAFLKINIWQAVSIIGVVAFTVTALGFILGRIAGRLMGKYAEAIGGLILILIGLRILLSHLL